MARKEEFDYARVPDTLYHGADFEFRNSIASKGLLGGHITDDADLAAEYGGDIWEIRKHPNITKAGNEWDDGGVYWANGVPSSHIKRVGHVISHFNEDGENTHNDIHWHPKEDCKLDYDMVFPKQNDLDEVYGKNARPHPTDPKLIVSDG